MIKGICFYKLIEQIKAKQILLELITLICSVLLCFALVNYILSSNTTMSQAVSPKLSTQATRLKYLRKVANLSNREVAEKIGRASSQVSRYESNATADIRDVVDKLAKLYKVTPDFILYGEDGPPAQVLEMRRQVAQLGIKPISEMPITYRTGDIEISFARRVPVGARATFAEMVDGSGEGLESFEEVPIQNPTPELRRPGCVEIEVNGDSMQPTLQSGWWVACYPIDKGDFKYLPSGIYAIVFGNFFVIKRIKSNDLLKDGTLTLHSDNENGGTLTVPGDELRGIYKVVKVTDGPLH
ncbi:LexA family transcriptional regulator [Hymenobacter sp. M29]|uniref:LexA family transcriptional regulator n=1 Tax=Hymenobacter mellowenesis TaxID=3063995 RepID=A0ABT9AJB4_9BACT|nr:LexA family transcriptional regulator [Hymenobacter sp. M29]MDO7849931.1 LexA family transcriptional regulator [Hymenobacter sp. M29]